MVKEAKMKKILIVDDNETDRYMLQVLLKGYGYEVSCAAHGAEALEMAGRDRPDMVISDIMMPVMDGFSLCREWKNDNQLRSIPFIFYTATFTDPKDEDFALSLGANKFIVKPTEPEGLVAMLLEEIREGEAGHPAVSSETEEETIYLKKYNATLIRKLEDKLVELEDTNRALRHDVARRKLVESELRHSEERYRDLYNNAPDGYCVVDTNGIIREMNATQLVWMGYGYLEIVNLKELEDLLLPDPERHIPQLLERCRQKGHLENVEQILVCKDGSQLPVRLNMRATSDRLERCDGYYVTTRDISREKSLEAQLLQARKLESLGRLTGGIAHDFNNMLTGILGYTQLLLQKVDVEGSIGKDLRHIEELGYRAADMVLQLMIFSRGKTSGACSLSLRLLLQEINRLLQRIIPENIKIEWKPAEDDITVKADPTQLQQVVMNLAVNARDAMPDGGQLVFETSKVELDDHFCQGHPGMQPGLYGLLKVRDTGVGIPREILPNIFDPFFTTKEVGKGTGLGLPVVYGIMKAYGGAVEVESMTGQGTTMKIFLPLSDQSAVKTERVGGELPKAKGRETILLVEDEPLLLDLGKKMLTTLGYHVLTARDGEDALKVFETHRAEIRLVILDVIMPKMGGREATFKLKGMEPAVGILLISGYDSPGVQTEEKLEHKFLKKPYLLQELAQAVRALLDLSPE
jgi:PAS domain S-box-containing protein